MANLMFFVPDELANRIAEARKTGLLPNKSKVVQDAFEAELDRLQSAKGPQGLEAIAARIIATQDAEAEQEEVIGTADGSAWARLRATSAELGRVKLLFDDKAALARFFDFEVHGLMLMPDARLAARIEATEPNNVRSEVFWNVVRALEADRAHLRVYRSERYLRAFMAAAVSVWDEVCPLVTTLLLRRAATRS